MEPVPPDDRETAYERRAPGWVIRCLTCGLTEPYGKHGIRLGAAGRPRKLAWCARCRRLRCHILESRPRALSEP